jgi:transcriptional regulator of acetoin/glycerol metabolism
MWTRQRGRPWAAALKNWGVPDPLNGGALPKPLLTDGDKMWAWERFLTGEPGSAMPLGNVVISSWQRSLKLGVNATGRAAPIAASGEKFAAIRHGNRQLIAASADIFRRMRDVFEDSRCMMLLTGPDGIVLEAVGDRRTLSAGERIHLLPGGQWCEDVIGTNGIGTALATGQPAQVHAVEHFCEGIKSWTCAGAPVREPGTGRILGVVDISGPPSTYHRGNLSLAVATARQVETALAERAGQERVRLLEHCLERLPPGTANFLVIDRAGRVVFAKGDAPALLPGLAPDEKLEGWARLLPAGDFDPVMLDGCMVGAVIVPGQKPRARPPPPAWEYFAAIVGQSPAMQECVARAMQLAPRRVALLIQGETGAGKEVLVRAIHAAAEPGPLVVFNCGAATKELLAAELFGHVRGAFTGALQEGKAGRFELAHGGILCLDEIGELPLDMQPILLRVLEEGVVYRVGDAAPRKVDVRLIALTNRNLRREVAAGRFRADLFYRLSVTSIEIPPLRARAGDVGILLDHYNSSLARKHGVPERVFGDSVRAALAAYAWPGNVRELRNLVEVLLLTASGAVSLAEFPPEIQDLEAGAGEADLRLDDVGRQVISRAIQTAGGNLSEAARKLGISRSTLHRRLRREGG